MNRTQEYDGKIYGLPFDACLLLLAYREDVYKELGLKVPETWEEYLENVKIIDKKSNVRGVSLMGKEDNRFSTSSYRISGDSAESSLMTT